MRGVYYQTRLKYGVYEIAPEVTRIPEFRMTGEGDVPFTTRLGGISIEVESTDALTKFMARVADFRDVWIKIVAVGLEKPIALYVGRGERGNWSSRRTVEGEKYSMSFVTPLGGLDPIDVNDPATARAYDTIPVADAIALLAEYAAVIVSGDPEVPILNNYSVIRMITRDLAADTETRDAGDEARALCVLSDGAVAVGCGRYVLLFKGGAWYGGAKLWFDEGAACPDDKRDLRAAMIAGPLTIVALGERSGKVYGVIGSAGGACAEFNFTAIYERRYPPLRVAPADLYWWWWDQAEIYGYFTQWRNYNSAGSGTESFVDTYAIGYPLLDPDKDIGAYRPQDRQSTRLMVTIPKGSRNIVVVPRYEIGDHIEIGGEYLGRVQSIIREASGRYNHIVERGVSEAKAAGLTVYRYRAATWPKKNLVIPRPFPISVSWPNPGTIGGAPKVDPQIIRHRGPGGGDMAYYRPAPQDIPDGDIDPVFVAIQAETALAELNDRYYGEVPRQFIINAPGRCQFPPDIAGGWLIKQSRETKNDDPGDPGFYKAGTKPDHAAAAGNAILIGDYLVSEAVCYRPDHYYYTALKIQKYAASRNEFDLVWRSREDAAATSGLEYYLTTASGIRSGANLYFGVRVRRPVWQTLDNRVVWCDFPQENYPDEDPPSGSKGAIAIAVHRDCSDYAIEGAMLKVEGAETAFPILEASAVWRDPPAERVWHPPQGAVPGYWEITGTCPSGVPTGNIPLTVILLYAPDFATQAAIKNYFCGKRIAISKKYQEYYAIMAFNTNTKTATVYPIKYNPATPKIDQEWQFAADDVKGESVSPDEAGEFPAYSIYRPSENWPVSGTAAVYVDNVEFDIEDITNKVGIPGPAPRKAYIDYSAGDDQNEMAVYLAAGYRESDVVIAFDYYAPVAAVAIWEWGGSIYYATRDGYIWKHGATATSVGRAPGDDPPLRVAGSGGDSVYFITRRGCLAQFAEAHSGAVEGEFGGDDTDAFKELAELSRLSLTPIRENGAELRFGFGKAFDVENATVIGIKPGIDYRGLTIQYAGGVIGFGDPKAQSELIANITAKRCYTPQMAEVIGARVWGELIAARKDIAIEGVTENISALLAADFARYDGDIYRIVAATQNKNRYSLRLRPAAIEAVIEA